MSARKKPASGRAPTLVAAAFAGVPEGLPAESVQTVSLGNVIVRGALLSELLADELMQQREATARPGESDEEAKVRATLARTLRTLARQVLDEAGQPIKTAAEWDVHGARHRNDVLALFNATDRLKGSAEEAEKN